MKKKLFHILILATILLSGCNSNSQNTSTPQEDKNPTVDTQDVQKTEDISNYLVTVDISNDNFEDYFECVKFKRYNSFGEELENEIGFGLKSKVYNEGLVLYDDGDISVGLKCVDIESIDSLSSLLSLSMGRAGMFTYDTFDISFTRVTEGTITFIRSEYISSYECEDTDSTYTKATITLQNGDIITRYLNPAYLY